MEQQIAALLGTRESCRGEETAHLVADVTGRLGPPGNRRFLQSALCFLRYPPYMPPAPNSHKTIAS